MGDQLDEWERSVGGGGDGGTFGYSVVGTGYGGGGGSGVSGVVDTGCRDVGSDVAIYVSTSSGDDSNSGDGSGKGSGTDCGSSGRSDDRENKIQSDCARARIIQMESVTMQIVQCDKHRRDADDMEVARRMRAAKQGRANRKEWLRRAKVALDRYDFELAIALIERAREEGV